MTMLAMIVSMVPIIAEGGAGALFRSPMAYAVIGGLITFSVTTRKKIFSGWTNVMIFF